MIIPSALFDVVLFGGLLIAIILDAALPQLMGAATVVALAAAIYVTAGELSYHLNKRDQWTQEALGTGVSLSVLFFAYWWLRNPSDLSLLALSVVLMMAALMITIAIISCLGTIWKQKNVLPIGGFLTTAIGGLILGGLAMPLVLNFGIAFKIAAVVIGGIIWKARERSVPLQESPEIEVAEGTEERWILLPHGGRLLDRLIPMLVLGVLLMFAAREMGKSATLPGTASIAAPAEH